MDNHYHLLIRINENPLGSFMRLLNGTYANYFRRKSKTRGYLFQDRYKSIVTQDQYYIEELVRYVHLNPIRAGICAGMKELDSYSWSGHSVVVGNRIFKGQNTADILKKFGREKKEAIEIYRAFLKIGLEEEPQFYRSLRSANKGSENIHDTGSWVIGNKEFVAKALAAQNAKQLRCARYAKESVDIDEMIEKILLKMNCSKEEILRRGRNDSRSKARKMCAYILNRTYEIPVIRIARYFMISSPAVSAMIRDVEETQNGKN
jgi:putative transposase